MTLAFGASLVAAHGGRPDGAAPRRPEPARRRRRLPALRRRRRRRARPPPTRPRPPNRRPPPCPFPADAKIAFVNLQRVVERLQARQGRAGRDEGAERQAVGRRSTAKSKDDPGAADKINTQRTVAADAILSSWTKDLDRAAARASVHAAGRAGPGRAESARNCSATFQQKVLPIVEAIRNEKGLWMVFQSGDDARPSSRPIPGSTCTAEVAQAARRERDK